MLSYYATLFRSVEINYTFRKFPSQKVLTSWAGADAGGVPVHPQGNQRITHVRRLREVAGDVRAFMTEAAVLGERLVPVLFQCPPTVEYDAPPGRPGLAWPGLAASCSSRWAIRGPAAESSCLK